MLLQETLDRIDEYFAILQGGSGMAGRVLKIGSVAPEAEIAAIETAHNKTFHEVARVLSDLGKSNETGVIEHVFSPGDYGYSNHGPARRILEQAIGELERVRDTPESEAERFLSNYARRTDDYRRLSDDAERQRELPLASRHCRLGELAPLRAKLEEDFVEAKRLVLLAGIDFADWHDVGDGHAPTALRNAVGVYKRNPELANTTAASNAVAIITPAAYLNAYLARYEEFIRLSQAAAQETFTAGPDPEREERIRELEAQLEEDEPEVRRLASRAGQDLSKWNVHASDVVGPPKIRAAMGEFKRKPALADSPSDPQRTAVRNELPTKVPSTEDLLLPPHEQTPLRRLIDSRAQTALSYQKWAAGTAIGLGAAAFTGAFSEKMNVWWYGIATAFWIAAAAFGVSILLVSHAIEKDR